MEIFDTAYARSVVHLLGEGKVGVLPTDTVYGLVADASNEQAVSRLYALKSRDQKPGTLIAASVDQLVSLGLKARYLKAVADYWPNPLTIIIPTGTELAYLHQNKYSLAVRVPSDTALHQFLEQTGPLLTTSANQPGKPPASSIKQAQTYFGSDVDFYADGGDLSGREASTIIRMVDDAVEIVRQGGMRINEETGRIES